MGKSFSRTHSWRSLFLLSLGSAKFSLYYGFKAILRCGCFHACLHPVKPWTPGGSFQACQLRTAFVCDGPLTYVLRRRSFLALFCLFLVYVFSFPLGFTYLAFLAWFSASLTAILYFANRFSPRLAAPAPSIRALRTTSISVQTWLYV